MLEMKQACDEAILQAAKQICMAAITAPKAGVSSVALEGKTLRFENTDKVWVFNAEGRLVKYANGGISALSTEGYAPGVYLVRMQSGQVMRTTKLVVK